MNDDQVRHTAQAASRRLTTEFGPELNVEVELALQRTGEEVWTDRYGPDGTLLVSIGSLIVTTAQMAWTIYSDLRKQTPKPSPEVIERKIRVKLDATDTPPSSQRDQIIEVVVSETVRMAGPA